MLPLRRLTVIVKAAGNPHARHLHEEELSGSSVLLTFKRIHSAYLPQGPNERRGNGALSGKLVAADVSAQRDLHSNQCFVNLSGRNQTACGLQAQDRFVLFEASHFYNGRVQA